MIKKILLTLFVLFTFVIYSIHQRSEHSSGVLTISKTTKPENQSPTRLSLNSPGSSSSSNTYRDGVYTGKAADAIYGYIKVKMIVTGGRLTDVIFLQYPDRQPNSVEINSQAMPLLKQQAIQVQSARVDGVSGASDTSQAFVESLTDALLQAQA